MNPGDPRASARITLGNLIAARWVLIALAAAILVLASFADPRASAGLLPQSEHPLALVACLVVWSALNLGTMFAVRKGRVSEGLAGGHLLTDAIALTVLLALSGGPANPFTILYFFPITLATQVSPRWTWALAGACVACFAGLFLLTPVDATAPAPAPQELHDPHAHHGGHHEPDATATTTAATTATTPTDHAEHFEGHQRGMWVAFGIAGILITVFVHRTALALARQREELARLRRVALEDRHLTAIGTLAAGAAHELGTPLATISVLVDELPHMSADEIAETRATIQAQLGRCKIIVSRMASPELRVSALGAGESWTLVELIDELRGQSLDVPLTIHASDELAARACRQPFEVLSQLLRELIANAAEACRRRAETESQTATATDCGIEVVFGEHAGRLTIEVVDRGVGMSPEALASAFDPFHSTRPEGEGLGLGLYLVRAHLRQLGGTIELRSALGRGTRAHLSLPFANLEPKA